MSQLITAVTVGIVWTIRHRERVAGFLAEVLAFAAVTVLVATVAAPVWGLVPVAVYFQLQAIGLARRGTPRGGR